MKNEDYDFLFNKPEDPKNLKCEPVFENKYLEKITVTSPLIALVSYFPLVILAAAHSITNEYMSIRFTIFIGITGFIFWSLAEYLIHRYLYHIKSNIPLVRTLQFLFHGFHHKHPGDKHHLFMPFYGGWPVACLFMVIFYLTLSQYSFMFFSGFYSGYLFYVFNHYFIHRFPPPHPWLKPIWKHHLLHHFKYPDKAFGFSTRIWDQLFGTMPP